MDRDFATVGAALSALEPPDHISVKIVGLTIRKLIVKQYHPSPDAADVKALHDARFQYEDMLMQVKDAIVSIRAERTALRGAIDTLQQKAAEAFSILERKIEDLKAGATDDPTLADDLQEILDDLKDARQDIDSTRVPLPSVEDGGDPTNIGTPGVGSNPINNPIDLDVNAAGGDPIVGSGQPRPADPVPADPAGSTGVPPVGSTTSAPDPTSQAGGLGVHHNSDSSNVTDFGN